LIVDIYGRSNLDRIDFTKYNLSNKLFFRTRILKRRRRRRRRRKKSKSEGKFLRIFEII
jgi:hypothetical protein